MNNQKAIQLSANASDDLAFISIIEVLLNNYINSNSPNEIFIIKINNWFDKKWLNFTGKYLGALGYWHNENETRVPPFSPNRVVGQVYYLKNNNCFYKKEDNNVEIHKRQSSEQNHQRLIKQFTKSGIFIWYSSNTISNTYGSVMVYKVIDNKVKTFYLGFKKNTKWDIISSLGIDKEKLI